MKRIFFVFIFFSCISVNAQTPACYLNIDSVSFNGFSYLNPDTVGLCQGNYVFIYSTAYCLNSYFAEDFNSGTLGPIWSTTSTPMFTNPCGAGSDGTIYLWIGPATNFPRQLTTNAFQVTTQCQICFDMKYASQGNSTPCEGPDEPTEGVHLQWSFNVGGPWLDINYWDPVGGYDPYLTTWHQYCEDVPVNGTVYFRWYQTNTSGNDYDHWGIDNVVINSSSAIPVTVQWSNDSAVFSTNNNVIVNPGQTTTYTVTLNNGSLTLQDSVHIMMLDTNMSISGLDSLYYTNSPPVVINGSPQPGYFTGPGIFNPNIFSPQHAGSGIHDITWHHYVVGSFPQPGNGAAFSDDFSTDKGWTGYGSGGWTRASAVASAGCSGSQDPSADHTTTADNFIIGNYIGACYPNSMAQTYWLTSPVINCSGQNSCALEFYSFSGCESSSYDHMYIDVYNGTSWTNIYSNAGSFSETAWTLRNYNVTQANNNANFQVRFGLGLTDGSVTYQGWNIDDLAINCTGTVPVYDTLCELSYTQQVTVLFPTGEELNEELSGIKVFPNPAGDVLYIITDNNIDDAISIYDIDGRIVKTLKMEGNSCEISLENIPSGTYMLKFGNNRCVGCVWCVCCNKKISYV